MSSDPHSPESITLAALGMSSPPPAPPAAGPAAAAVHREIREVQDTAALAWLALSDLQAAPDSIWQGIEQRLELTAPASPAASLPASPPAQKLPRTAAWSGWAAAAALALGWWLQESAPGPQSFHHPEAFAMRPVATPIIPEASTSPRPADSAPALPEQEGMRQELLLLRKRLAAATPASPAQGDAATAPGMLRPAILELRTPGTPADSGGDSGSSTRLQQLVTRALQKDLLLRQPAASATVVLEHGWPQAGWIRESSETIRHLSFPAGQWQELGLWKGPNQFYDPNTSLSWTPAPDGLGYLGRVSPQPPDPEGYVIPGEASREPVEDPGANPVATASAPPVKPSASPAGYLVSEPNSGDATLLLTGLPPVPPGSAQYVVATSVHGTSQTYLLPVDPSGLQGLTLSSLNLPGNFTSFQVIQSNGTNLQDPTVLLSGGAPQPASSPP